MEPGVTILSAPALATGGTLWVSMVTVSGAELTNPSLTMSCATSAGHSGGKARCRGGRAGKNCGAARWTRNQRPAVS